MTIHHGSQFYANESVARKRGESAYEKKLVELGIRQILARVKRPQTNGKLERFHGEIQRKLHRFESVLLSEAVRTAPKAMRTILHQRGCSCRSNCRPAVRPAVRHMRCL